MRRTCAIWVNALVGFVTIFAWLHMALFSHEAELLAMVGIMSLKFFTVLSNLFNGLTSLVYAWWLARGAEIGPKQKTLKLAATASVGLTFTTVAVFLGPLYGFPAMLTGANFFFHLVLPVASMLSFVFLERGPQIPRAWSLWAVAPAAVYAMAYVANIAINGKGEWPASNDWYGFLNWGNGVGAVIAIVIMLMIWGIAHALCHAGKAYLPAAER